MNKSVVTHTSALLIIGLGLRQRFFRLGLGFTLSLLALLGILQLLGHGGLLGAAILLPLLAGLALTGFAAIYYSLIADNEVYDKASGRFIRYAGNALTGKRVAESRALADFTALEQPTGEPPRLSGQGEPLALAAYDETAVRAVAAFLGLADLH